MLDQIMQHASKVKLSGGLIGRVCSTLVIISIVIGCIAIKSSTWWIAPLTILLLLALTFIILWRVLMIAEKNPHAAILDGAEFFQYEMRQQLTKNGEVISLISNSQTNDPLLESPSEDVIAEADVPDEAAQNEAEGENK